MTASLFRLQHALALTRADLTVLGTLLLLLALGLAGRVWQGEALAFDPALYAPSDAAIAAAVAQPPEAEAAPAEATGTAAEATGTAVAAEPHQKRKRVRVDPTPVNVNAATAEQMDSLPGIGPALAARIVAYREQHGAFARPEHLQRVKGIGAKTFAKMAPYVRVE